MSKRKLQLSRAAMKAHVKEKADFAVSLADDGAFLSCARILRELADECDAHQHDFNARLDRLVEGTRQ